MCKFPVFGCGGPPGFSRTKELNVSKQLMWTWKSWSHDSVTLVPQLGASLLSSIAILDCLGDYYALVKL